ncbi:hypothetical protein [Hydrogenophaga sp. OTU3427]|uniref:hypothetical protein n=1 Tax=Hydrogenophaga sp. OTU3427 TaxID=3043856 RepID=UPI00313E07D5
MLFVLIGRATGNTPPGACGEAVLPVIAIPAFIELRLSPSRTNLVHLRAHPAQIPPGTGMGGQAHLGKEVLVPQRPATTVAISRIARVFDRLRAATAQAGFFLLNKVLSSHPVTPWDLNFWTTR